ncbi:hypothetical protein CN636_29160 [Bacillus toyonensis]|nr:hypothetical protein CN636_29160 [Bacillus toyonensis]
MYEILVKHTIVMHWIHELVLLQTFNHNWKHKIKIQLVRINNAEHTKKRIFYSLFESIFHFVTEPNSLS